MFPETTLSKHPTRPLELDHQQLYEIGLKHIQRLSSRIWTDYNIHDPGITALELLCYALTDLSYRASFPIEDLLASETDNQKKMQEQFFTARKILPNRALTTLDYRKLLIDLPGVKNAWIEPAKPKERTYYADTRQSILLQNDPGGVGIVPVELAGLYDILIDYADGLTDADKGRIMQDVAHTLHANRNLCEDFVAIRTVDAQHFLLCAELEIASDADVSQVKAEILFKVEQYLDPPVRNYTLSEMLDRKKVDGAPYYTTDEIFDGPMLDCGFIDDEELGKATLRKSIRLSDVISIVMDIPGVRVVRDIVISPNNREPLENKWVVPVFSGNKAILERNRTRLVFYKRNMPVMAVDEKVTQYYEKLAEDVRRTAETPVAYDLEIPLGTYRQSDRYYSFQNHFPAVYGLSEAGLSSAVGEQRKALAYQLKAYLLFLDQIMADYCAQLSHVKQLFSTDVDFYQTYFFQVVKTFAEYSKIYRTTDIRNVSDVEKMLQDQNAQQEQEQNLNRRNRFLDHLIARFAERFYDFAHIMYSKMGTSSYDDAGSMMQAKCEFLQQYPRISNERSLAYNYTQSSTWDTENMSGLEKRLAKLLGIQNYSQRYLTHIDYVITYNNDKWKFEIIERLPLSSSFRLVSIIPYNSEEEAIKGIKCAIHFAGLREKYKQVMINGSCYLRIIDNAGQEIAQSSRSFGKELVEKIINTSVKIFNSGVEGMHLIENILLRPEPGSDSPFLPIHLDSACTDCPERDPYSYRLHIILPAYGSRFGNIEFRRFAEELIREETPAHILPKICWISQEDMVVLEKLYSSWIDLKSGSMTGNQQEILEKFIKALFEIKNVYPSGYLHDCSSPKLLQKFILGQTVLGTKDIKNS